MASEYRHEWKYEINACDHLMLRQRLKVVMKQDANSEDGCYRIRSLYFDTPGDKALLEKIDGVNEREKFRIRYYNGDTGFIRLEKKSKKNGLSKKIGVTVTAAEVKALLAGDTAWMNDSARPLVQELYTKMRCDGLKPRTIVDYTREAFTYGPGNVRVTIDYNIRTGMRSLDFLNPDCVTVPVVDSRTLLEVKWDEFLPDCVKSAVRMNGRRVGAFSKYAACRCFG